MRRAITTGMCAGLNITDPYHGSFEDGLYEFRLFGGLPRGDGMGFYGAR